jgi:ABC-type Fe3+/spermidine/putrescine transport system ATPase subunit
MAVYHRPADRFVAGFIGESNFFPGRVAGSSGSMVEVEAAGFAHPIHAVSDRPVAPGKSVTVMVRPEHLEVLNAPDESFDNNAQALVTKVAFLGMYTQIGAELAGGVRLTVHQTSEASAAEGPQISVGQPVFLGWKSADGRVLLEDSAV